MKDGKKKIWGIFSGENKTKFLEGEFPRENEKEKNFRWAIFREKIRIKIFQGQLLEKKLGKNFLWAIFREKMTKEILGGDFSGENKREIFTGSFQRKNIFWAISRW